MNKFYLNALLIFGILTILFIYSINRMLPQYNGIYIFMLPAFGLIISTLAYFICRRQRNKQKLNLMLSSLFGIKFFSFIIIALVFFSLEKEREIRVLFLASFFLVYISNTILLLLSVLKYLKTIGNNNGISR